MPRAPASLRQWIAPCAAICIAGCAADRGHFGREAEGYGYPPRYARLHDSACYTVDLFDPFPIRPAGPDVPPRHAAFLGEWVGGAWDGGWCHDLLIYEVGANGAVRLVSLHAPNRAIGRPATAFRRDAVIGADDALRFANDDNRHVYTLAPARAGNAGPDYLTGRRTGPAGEYDIVLTRKGG